MADPPDRPDQDRGPPTAQGGRRHTLLDQFRNLPLVARLSLVTILAIALVFAAAAIAHQPSTQSVPTTLSSGPAGASDVHLSLSACGPVSGRTAKGSAQIDVGSPYSVVTFSVVYEENGVSLGQGVGTVSDLKPGTTYRTDVTFSLDADPAGTGACRIRLLTASA